MHISDSSYRLMSSRIKTWLLYKPSILEIEEMLLKYRSYVGTLQAIGRCWLLCHGLKDGCLLRLTHGGFLVSQVLKLSLIVNHEEEENWRMIANA